MAGGNEIGEFLTTRRARITPTQAGLSAYGRRRRVAGLRREEVAMLAGISVEYYTQLERGSIRGVSEDLLDHPRPAPRRRRALTSLRPRASRQAATRSRAPNTRAQSPERAASIDLLARVEAYEDSALLYGAFGSTHGGVPPFGADATMMRNAGERLRSKLGDDAFGLYEREGSTMTEDDVIALALDALRRVARRQAPT